MSGAAQSKSTLREYVAALRRRWTYVAGALVVAVLVAAVYSYTRTPMYEAFARLAYQKQADLSSLLTGSQSLVSSVDVQRELETYSSLMTTAEMAERARRELDLSEVADLGATIIALPVKDTSVMQIRAVSDDPQVAQRVANAYAAGFYAWRKQVAIDQIRDAQKAVVQKLSQYKTETEKQDPGYFSLLSRLEDLRVLETVAQGNFTIVSEAELPTEPFEPKHARDIVLGLLVGLLVGVFLVAIAEQLDIRVHTQEDIGTGTGLPILGRLPRVSRELSRTTALAVLKEPEGASAEAFRMLRGNLEFVNVDGEVSTFLFTSPTQGEGKTTAVCNLAVTLARTGKRVIVVDCDLRRPRVHAYFNLANREGVSTVVAGRSNLAEVLQPVAVPMHDERSEGRSAGPDGGARSIHVLTSGPLPPNPGEIAASRKLASLLAELERNCDVLLVDAPPFLAVGDSAALARSVGGVILVTRLGTATKAMLHEAVEYLATLPCRTLGVVVTNLPIEARSYRYKYYRDASGDEPDAPSMVEAEPFSDPALVTDDADSLRID